MSVRLIVVLISYFISSSVWAQDPMDAPKYFPGKNGCFLLYNMKTGAVEKEIGSDKCRERVVACSTFKVPLAVMALDAGILKDENQVLKWDGKKEARPELNQDHDAKTWMKHSVVWFSQRLTPELGEERFKKYLSDFQYGNQDLAGGITHAWLVSPSQDGPALKISAYEQMKFMKKLWREELPVSPRAMQITRDITYLETSANGFKMHGKTGSNFYDDKRRLGWFIAHLEDGKSEYITVVNFSDREPPQEEGYGGAKAKEITKTVLSDLGIWEN